MSSEKRLEGMNIIVTGANCGIGYEAALDMARRGAHVILACRDQAKADEACAKIKAETKNDNVEVELLDLGSFKSIKKFSERILAKLDKLDILINNAGLFSAVQSKTVDGFESHFGVNYLGPYYLTRLLLDLIKKSAPSRIINVSSEGHRRSKMNWEDLNNEKSFSGFTCYAQSKLGNILFTVELEKRLKGTGVSTVSLHPGVVYTDIMRKREGQSFGSTILMGILSPLFAIFGKNSANGAKTTIHCAISDDIPNQSGLYFDNSKVRSASSEAMDPESAERLWKLSAELVGLQAD